MLKYLESYAQGFFGMVGLFAVVYFIIWFLFGKQLKNRKIQLSKRAGWAQIKDEVTTAAISGLGSTLFTVYLFSLKDSGMTKFYNETGKFGLWYEAFIVVAIILLNDAWFYWLHRGMHHPKVYKYVHALHHRSLDVNPFTSNSFHVIESVALTAWLLPFILYVPISATALGIVQAVGMFNNLKSHLGYELFPGFFNKVPGFNMLVTATNHSLHHTQYNGNYGLFFRFWDIVCDTELKTTSTLFQEIHERKDEQVIDNTKYKTLTISQLVKETNDTVSVYFKPTDKQFYDYAAGQYLTVKVKVGNKTYDRCFSLSSSPQIDDFLRITVKLKRQVSNYFYNEAKVGDTIEALYPVGDFKLKPAATASKNYVMVAGGSGITPLFSMTKAILNFEPQSKVSLLYANKSADSIIFKQELDTLAKSYPQFKYIDFISGQNRISEADLAQNKDATFYICGPDALKDGIKAHLKALKVDKANINMEHFADGYLPWFGLF
jgi:ring-1,2-phenylacetyl-CoA epoxidase subunit PaaE